MKDKVIQTQQYFSWLTTADSAHYGHEVRSLTRRGEVRWDELPFTEADLEREMRTADVRQAQQYFYWLRTDTGVHYGHELISLIRRNGVRWEELSFTEADLEREMEAKKT